MVGFQFRYHPTLNKARELIQAQSLGKILSAHAHWGEYLPNWHPWEDYRKSYAARAELGGGVIVTLTHPLDYLRFLLGDVDSLWSFNGHLSPLELDVEDGAEIGLKFQRGGGRGACLITFSGQTVTDFDIVGTNGTLRWDNADGVLRFFRRMPAEFGTWDANPPTAVEEQYLLPQGFERNQLFEAQMRHFVKTAQGPESDPICTLADGVNALQLALAAQSHNAYGRVVKI